MQPTERLSGTELRLLEQLAYLIALHRQRRPGGTPYATPGRAWLAARLGTCETTISRASHSLARRGLLRVVQRRPRAGRWQTCLYQIVDAAGWAGARLAANVRSLFHRMTEASDKRRSINNGRRIKNMSASRAVEPAAFAAEIRPPPPPDLSRLSPRLRAVLARYVESAPIGA